MVNYEHYTYRITWSGEDQEFVGLCAEFPSLSYLHRRGVKALEGIRELVEDVVLDMKENGESIPDRFSSDK